MASESAVRKLSGPEGRNGHPARKPRLKTTEASNGRVHDAEPVERFKDDRFSMYTSPELGEEIREYCWASRTSFNDLAKKALREYMDRHPSEPAKLVRRRLPTGPSLKPKRI